ncbi:MAG: rubredoxin [Snowella sp.]|jgi:rubredoxin|nr:rubredoxin [Snowella sp.]PZV23410.1 MAG: rubredoxin [Snowella sp.]
MSDRPQEKTLVEKAAPSYECRACGYVYVPTKGDSKAQIPPGTPFEDLPENWNCPVCSVPRKQFFNIGATDAPSGFEENLNYGFGFNRMTPDQKNLLIFGALFLGFISFIGLYGLN